MNTDMVRVKVDEVVKKQLSLTTQDLLDVNAQFTMLGADVLDLIEIVMRVEELFGLEISDEDAQDLTTVAHIVAYVASHKKD